MEAGANARLRRGGLVFAAALAWFTFMLGLIGPLTPSEGSPPVFIGIPEFLFIVGGLVARTTPARVAFVLQAAAIAALGLGSLLERVASSEEALQNVEPIAKCRCSRRRDSVATELSGRPSSSASSTPWGDRRSNAEGFSLYPTANWMAPTTVS